MLPTKAVRLRLGTLLSTDTTTLNQAANANHVSLIKAPFVPSENLLPADLTVADFDGFADLLQTLGAALVGVDPVTGDQVVTITAPAGGWRWITTGLTNLPQSIYGFALFDKTHANLWATILLPTPIVLQDVGQQIELGDITLTLVQNPMF